MSEETAYDRRHPLYIGEWMRSLAWKDDGWAREDLDEPHPKRRQAIIDKHPKVTWLYHNLGWHSRPMIVMMVACQLVLAYGFGCVWKVSWPVMVLTAWMIGGSLTHIAGVFIHEACHGLVAKTPLENRIWGLISNIAIPFPIASSFRRYHLEHHTYQGVEGKDPDLPIPIELVLIKGNTLCKFLWIAVYPLLYVLRGAYFGKAPSRWEIINASFTILTDVILYSTFGGYGFTYLFLSFWLGYTFHPAAAHFIQEHYTFADGQETYSYYGPANLLFLNIGFHNEHHDFPPVAWHLLPFVKAIAPESYDPLAAHMSWTGVLYSFITDKNLGPQSRVVRSEKIHKTSRKQFAETCRTKNSPGTTTASPSISAIKLAHEMKPVNAAKPVEVF